MFLYVSVDPLSIPVARTTTRRAMQMERNPNAQAAAAAVEAAAGGKGWNISDLASAAGVDYGTVSDFIQGKRWAQTKTRAAIEKALDWPVGTIQSIARGGPVPSRAPGLPTLELPESLTREDRQAIEAIVYQLAQARRWASPPAPDLKRVQGLRIREDEDGTNDRAGTKRNE